MLDDFARKWFRVKAALAIRFEYQGVSFGFVGGHLHPHEQNYHRRLENYRQIVEDMQFGMVKGKILDQE